MLCVGDAPERAQDSRNVWADLRLSAGLVGDAISACICLGDAPERALVSRDCEAYRLKYQRKARLSKVSNGFIILIISNVHF